MEDDTTTTLEQVLESYQREALNEFRQKLLPVLKRCNLGSEDFLEVLALTTDFFIQGNSDFTIKLLEKLSREIRHPRL